LVNLVNQVSVLQKPAKPRLFQVELRGFAFSIGGVILSGSGPG